MEKPVGNYRPYRVTDHVLYVSQVPLKDGRIVNPGTLGQDLTIEQGQQAAMQAALNISA